ncbi:hypothetical protein HZS55_11425 [Halosimplex rubrum]|uniref:Uncharacterized protein n=1 Tax=Halosimplex rubrum TaxID=869889 RepID=A0A7D5SYG7_9EURY|nr:hypothetical protein [Halosimplex rubrum]QLH77871.1 hypothetical protein HZS55_11425 [Halosimplex rubrum]
MGRTLLGIDLDESPVGGLIEGLLSDEDLEKLTDGGRDVDDERAADGGDEPPREADDDDPAGDATDDATAVGTDLVDDAVGAEDTDESDAGESAASSDAESIPVGTSATGESDGWDTPNPDGPAPVPSPGEENVDDEDGGWKAKLRPILLKATAALLVLAVVGFLAYRYLGKATSVASDTLGSDEDEPDSPPTTDAADGDAPEARRRAKAPERDDREEFADRPVDETVGHAERAEAAGESGAADDDGTDGTDGEADDGDAAPETVGRPTADSDVGALVGLAALALVAAVVRKFGEDREYDPLVDGPTGDGDDE